MSETGTNYRTGTWITLDEARYIPKSNTVTMDELEAVIKVIAERLDNLEAENQYLKEMMDEEFKRLK